MAISKTVKIDGVDVEFKSSAAIPRLYRLKFRRDVFLDMKDLKNTMKKRSEEDGFELSIDSLEVFENIAYIMAKHANPEGVPNNPDEWFEKFNTFSIYDIMPKIFELWALNTETTATAKKNKKA